jgi:hypothetical protein
VRIIEYTNNSISITISIKKEAEGGNNTKNF